MASISSDTAHKRSLDFVERNYLQLFTVLPDECDGRVVGRDRCCSLRRSPEARLSLAPSPYQCQRGCVAVLAVTRHQVCQTTRWLIHR